MKKIYLFIFIIFLAGCATINEMESFIKDLETGEFAELIASKDVFVLDVHIPEQQHIKETDALIPYNEIEQNLDKLPKDKNTPIAVYCRSGRMSAEAAQTLQELGYSKIYNLLGGTKAWRAARLEFEQKVSNKITVFKSAECGCCVNYVPYLKRQGFAVETRTIKDMVSIKRKYNIPRHMESCHTAIVGDYFVEGHVPVEAVNKLLEENPDIDGIALPGMPSGSPGMPGAKREPFKIYALSDGSISEFMNI